jgi:hypothetical protein
MASDTWLVSSSASSRSSRFCDFSGVTQVTAGPLTKRYGLRRNDNTSSHQSGSSFLTGTRNLDVLAPKLFV